MNFKRENRDREKVLKQGEDSRNFDSIISKIPILTVALTSYMTDYSQNRDLRYKKSKFPLSSLYLSTFFTIPILPFKINNFLIYLVQYDNLLSVYPLVKIDHT